MVTRRPSSSQFKRTSRQVRQATIKSQLPSESSSIYSRKKKFSDTRRARTAQRGEIHQVLPSTSTRESRRAYENRIGQRDYLKRSVDAGRRRKAVIGIALATYSSLVLSPAVYALIKKKWDAKRAENAKYNYASDKKKKESKPAEAAGELE